MLPKKHIEYEHQAEACEERVGRTALGAVGMCFGDHFIADDIEHRTAGKGEGEGQDRGSDRDGKVAEEGACDLHESRCKGDEEGTPR